MMMTYTVGLDSANQDVPYPSGDACGNNILVLNAPEPWISLSIPSPGSAVISVYTTDPSHAGLKTAFVSLCRTNDLTLCDPPFAFSI